MALGFLLFFFSLSPSGIGATVFTFYNHCPYTVWAGIQPSAGYPMIGGGGFRLDSGRYARIPAILGWSGRFWPRRGCTFNASGRGACMTGDCGGLLHCDGAGGSPPMSLAEFTLNSPADYYDVSLVDGYNAPVSVVPSNQTCRTVRCVADVNRRCPAALSMVEAEGGEVVACKSACMAFGTPQTCCTGEYGSPATCRPTAYSWVFKWACPTAYSYAYDDPTSIFTCHGSDYLIRFC